MRHRRRVKHFGRKSGPRKALLRGLMVSLVEHGRIATTVEKAKELRRHIERAITLGKKQDLPARRLLISRIANVDTVETILSDLSKRFDSRPGGYTRIIKIGRRPGDTAEMAFIEFVDYDYETAGGKKETNATKGKSKAKSADVKTAKAAANKIKKAASKLVIAKRKSVKKMQKKSRQESRA
jgi:large subunit ribosomal protein L17